MKLVERGQTLAVNFDMFWLRDGSIGSPSPALIRTELAVKRDR